MSRRSSVPPEPDTSWQAFQKQFPDHPHIRDESLLALPEGLLTALRECVPELLTNQDAEFEQALRESAATGFFRQQRLVSTALEGTISDGSESGAPSCPNAVEIQQRSGLQTLQDLVKYGAISDRVAIARQQRELDLNRAEHLRLRGYVGYLLANPIFRADLSYLRRYLCDPPALDTAPKLIHDNKLPPGPGRPAFRRDLVRSQARQFLGRWSLNRMLTWDLPDPTPAVIHPRDAWFDNREFPAGIALFLPWSLLADQAFTGQFLDNYQRRRVDLRHLADWIGERNEWGPTRYERLLEYYVYRYHVIEKRYAKTLRRRIGWVDQAFQSFWGLPYTDCPSPHKRPDVDSTLKKIKAHLNRRLTETAPKELCVFYCPPDEDVSSPDAGDH